MGLLADISTSLGTPAWGAAIAMGVFALASSIEPAMRPEARQQLAAFLQRARVTADLPSAAEAVRHAFEATFGSRQLSLKCLCRSLLFSAFLVLSVSLLIWSKHGMAIRARYPDRPGFLVLAIAGVPSFLVLSALPDWLSLGKTRWVLRHAARAKGAVRLGFWIVIDLLLSYAIAMSVYWGVTTLALGRSELCDTYAWYAGATDCARFDGVGGFLLGVVAISFEMTARAFQHIEMFTPQNVFAFAYSVSTLLTSIWTVLVLAALLLLRTALSVNPILRAVRWAFDVEQHPVRLAGGAAAAVVRTGSVVYAVV